MAQPFESQRLAADVLVLDPMGVLHEEPTRLLLEESPPALPLRPLLDAIGAGSHRVSEIAGRIGQPATSLARPLARLQELDMVVREIPFGEPQHSSKRALYKLADPFLRLWFSLLAPKRSLLAQLPRKSRLNLFDDAFPQLTAAAWENLCRMAVPRLEHRLGARYGSAMRYWLGSGPEWDVVAEALNGGGLLLGEAKWMEGTPSAPAVERVVQDLIAKGVPAVRRHETAPVRYAVFVPRRPKGKLRIPTHVQVLDARDVLRALR